jgi:geranylgeranyl diphosphate synthase, type II
MDVATRLEAELDNALTRAGGPDCPPILASAMRYAVFPGGARIRPRFCLAVAMACDDRNPSAAITAAAAIELLHCASLVHDDLPCFDAADLRRGKPSVHAAYGERTAVLVGDALIVLAFEQLAIRLAQMPDRLGPLVRIIGAAVGGPLGIAAGQAWECEPEIDLGRYQRSKTGALFAACTMAGAAAAGYEAEPWRALGYAIGEAFQVADDLRDVAGSAVDLGKPTGQDAIHHRPNAVAAFGFDGAMQRFDDLLQTALAAIPPCPGSEPLGHQIKAVSQSLVTGLSARTVAA